MVVSIKPELLKGHIRAVSSKSQIHRLIICAMQAKGETVISFRGLSKDIAASCECAKKMGADVILGNDEIIIRPGAFTYRPFINCGESGSTARFFIPALAALCDGGEITGEGRLPKRPFSQLTRELRNGGCSISDDSLPMTIKGSLKPGKFVLEGNVSSQYFTGLMMALPSLDGDSIIEYIPPLESAPYIDITISVLKKFGVEIQKGDNCFLIPGNQKFVSPGKIIADGDWSNAAFFVAANHIGSDVVVDGLDDDSAQGDKRIKELVDCDVVDVTDVPDLVPALAVCGAALREKTVITGGARLKLKESDRIASTAAMIRSLGGRAEETDDGLIIYGGLKGGRVDSFGDHRIVMAAAAASCVCSEPVIIDGAENADKSYPDFFDDFKKLGGVFDVGC